MLFLLDLERIKESYFSIHSSIFLIYNSGSFPVAVELLPVFPFYTEGNLRSILLRDLDLTLRDREIRAEEKDDEDADEALWRFD